MAAAAAASHRRRRLRNLSSPPITPDMKLSVRTKLFAGFGVVLTLLAVAVVVSLTSMSTMHEKAGVVAKTDLPSVATIGEIVQHVEWYRATQLGHALSTSAEQMTKREGLLEKEDGLVQAGFAKYGKNITSAQDRRYFEQARKLWDEYKAGTAEIVALNRAGNTTQAVTILNDNLNTVLSLLDHLTKWSQYNQQAAARDIAAETSTAQGARTTLVVLGIIAGLIGAVIAFLISRSIATRTKRMLHAAEGIAGGDVEQTVQTSGSDELAQTGRAFEEMIDYLKETGQNLDRVAGGDLTVEVRPKSERDLLGNATQRLVTNLRAMIGDVSRTAETVSAASQQMASTSDETGRAVGEIASAVSDVAQGTERQVRMVEAARVAVQKASAAAAGSARTAGETTDAADQARSLARDGVEAIDHATDAIRQVADASSHIGGAIEQLAERSERIGGIVDTITGIAGQTNLLALNAAIEAARAGEQGRGFAVVAEEVRKLAEESQQAAATIARLIEEIQTETSNVVGVVEDGARRTQEGVETVEQTRAAFQAIGEAVEAMSARVSEIATAVTEITEEASRAEGEITEVAAVAEQSSASAEQVSASTQQTSASTQEVASSAAELSRTAEELEQLVRRFQVTAAA
jgi:methyl-accepting chemotaxis protein